MEASNKIVELSDDSALSADERTDEDEDEVPLKFKESVLKNKSIFERQLLESDMVIDPAQIFEMTPPQEVEGETHEDLFSKMQQDILQIPVEDDTENKLLKLSAQMTPLPGFDGIFKKLCKVGEGSCPPLGSYVTVHYNGYVCDEVTNEVKPYDSTVLRDKPLTFLRGGNDVMEFLDVAVGSMKLQEQSEFVISPDKAFGSLGCPPRIPADAYLYFKIDLIEWIDSGAAEAFGKLPIKARKDMPFQHVLEASKSEKRKGTFYFEKQNYALASRCYTKALGWILDRGYADEEEEKLGEAQCLKLQLDLALIYLKLNKPKKTCIHCKEALLIDPNNAKASYRFGVAQEKLGDLDAARRSFLKAKNICPDDPSIARALIALSSKMQKENYIEKDLCRKMLGLPTAVVVKESMPTEESHKVIRRQLEEFVSNPKEMQIAFPPGMAQQERAFLEAEVRRLDLKFAMKPTMKGDGVCTVSKQ